MDPSKLLRASNNGKEEWNTTSCILPVEYRRICSSIEGGGVAEWLECWTCNPEDPSLRPTLTASWICFTENLSFQTSATIVNSQLVCLWPVGILNTVMFNLYVDLIIYSMALKSADGELSLEVVIVIVCNGNPGF